MHADPKSAIKLLNLTIFLALLGSGHVKAARRTLVKLTLGLLQDSELVQESLQVIFLPVVLI